VTTQQADNGLPQKKHLADYVNKQLENLFPDGNDSRQIIDKNIGEAMDRMAYSLKHVKLGGYTRFDILHSDLYAQFIYFLSNSVWNNDKDRIVSTKLYYLNKALHGLNCMYDTRLPEIFLLIHCIGSMLGKANYSNYFVACHNVTVGTDKGNFPQISKGVYMGPGSSIIGNSSVGEYTHLTINAVVLNQNTQGDCVVIGASPEFVAKPLSRNLITETYFDIK
jgi:serine O-acetyltransferase